MPIQELNPQEFGKGLAQQALEFVPADFTDEHKQFVAHKVLSFCVLAGEHLIKQYNDQFNDEEAIVVVQFIGEWTFHKSVDIIRAQLPKEHWDEILQQVAFAALKAALTAHTEKYDPTKTAAFIEAHVVTAYEETIKQMAQAGVIAADSVQEVLSHSNVDKMAQEQGGGASSSADQEKTLKFAVLGMVLKQMPESKVQSIIKQFGPEDQQKILSCMKIEGLEERLDASLIQEYMNSLKKNLAVMSKPKSIDYVKSIVALQNNLGEEWMIKCTLEDRPKIQKFLSACLFEDESSALKVELSPYIVKILYSYLNQKLSSKRVRSKLKQS